jgi:NAD(P)-dependent dehydrogenase (short-subunit alcohol dehydrogenase family)
MKRSLPKDASAIVTGAGSGFGRAVAYELAARGARVLASDIDEATAEETADVIRSRGGIAFARRTDVRDAEAVGELVADARGRFGGVDVMVNNAGLAVVGRMGEVPLEDWRLQIEVNLMGVLYGCHHVIPLMRAQKRGWILNVASAAGLLSPPFMGPYNVTKAGVVSLSETLHGELRGEGIGVTALCPTFFRTNIHKAQRSSSEMRARSAKLVEGAKWSAEEIAKLAVDGLLRDDLYVIPQLDGKILWRTRRLMGALFHTIAGRAVQRGMRGH